MRWPASLASIYSENHLGPIGSFWWKCITEPAAFPYSTAPWQLLNQINLEQFTWMRLQTLPRRKEAANLVHSLIHALRLFFFSDAVLWPFLYSAPTVSYYCYDYYYLARCNGRRWAAQWQYHPFRRMTAPWTPSSQGEQDQTKYQPIKAVAWSQYDHLFTAIFTQMLNPPRIDGTLWGFRRLTERVGVGRTKQLIKSSTDLDMKRIIASPTTILIRCSFYCARCTLWHFVGFYFFLVYKHASLFGDANRVLRAAGSLLLEWKARGCGCESAGGWRRCAADGRNNKVQSFKLQLKRSLS